MAYNNTVAKIGWSSADFMFSFGTFTVEDITAISWSDTQEMENVYGAGSEPIGFGVGKSTYEASITTLTETVLALLQQAPGNRLQNILPFDFIIVIVPTGSTQPVTVTLKNCKFKDNKFSMKSGDMMVEQELNLLYSGVKVE